jgi:hypothetical protein
MHCQLVPSETPPAPAVQHTASGMTLIETSFQLLGKILALVRTKSEKQFLIKKNIS